MTQTRYKMVLEYDGTSFEGWQKQPNQRSVQDALEEALQTRLQIKTPTQGAGRTDTGVHALGQVAHCDLPKLTAKEKANFCHSLNRMLSGKKIYIKNLEEVSSDFHARFSACGKYYVYRIVQKEKPLLKNLAYCYRRCIDMERLKAAASQLEGRHDFKGLANENTRGSAAHDSVRTIWKVAVVTIGDVIELHYVGEGFLYKMVRNCTSLLLDIATGKRRLESITQVLSSGQRPKLLYCAPAHGLTLMEVLYTEQNQASLLKKIEALESSNLPELPLYA